AKPLGRALASRRTRRRRVGPIGGARGVQGATRGEASLHRSRYRLLHRLLLRVAGARRLRAAPDGHEGARRRQRRLPVRAVAVLRRVAHRGPVRTGRGPLRFDGARRRSSLQGQALMSPALAMFLTFIAITLWITWWAA